jgi:DNA-binding transcriptional MerR regulator
MGFMPRGQQYLKTSEVARILGVSTQTIYNWLREGRISEPERHPLTSYRRWTTKDVDMIRNAVLESRAR